MPAAADKDAPPADPAVLRQENAELQRQLDAAESTELYLVLDAGRSRLRLMLAGVTLQEYEIEAAQVATPQILWKKQPAPGDWETLTWVAGHIDPAPERERTELTFTADGSVPPPTVPHIAGGPQKPPASGSYLIRYEGGLAVEVLYTYVAPDSQETRGPSLLQRARDRVAQAWTMFRNPQDNDAMRVRLRLAWEDACALYASLPPRSKLLFLTLEPAAER